MEPLILKSITIGKQCSKTLSKGLLPGTYKLAERLPFDLYGKNISVCAIVGKNGAGKTTLLDILFRIINNVSFWVIGAAIERNAAEPLYYVPGLYASVEYLINGKTCELSCKGDVVQIHIGDKKYYFTLKEVSNKESEAAGYILGTDIDEKERIALLNDMFFTIVTNYSLQAFNSNDYKSDESHYRVSGPGKFTYASDGNWMDSIFDKNDGYLVPLTFNPYRNRGKFDLQGETERTIARLSAILIQAKQKNKQVLEGYQLEDIHYEYDEYAIGEKLHKYMPKDDAARDVRIDSELYMKMISAYEEENNYLKVILKRLGLNYEGYDGITNNACIYLGYKILSIAGKYPQYAKFTALGNPWNIFREVEDKHKELLLQLVDTVKEDTSHIATKFDQTYNFLVAHKEGQRIDEKFKYEEYEKYVTEDKIKSRSVEGYMGILPPPIFKATIFLNPVIDEVVDRSREINLTHLSSGERQFLYMMSTLIYHIMNIKSVPDDREHYRNINLILDEIEICFHPEYQRMLVHWIVSTLKRLDLTNHCKFNIILTTHSPFILSDIAPSNILYLKKGEKPSNTTELDSPFAANMNDALRWSFFLEKGFMGEFAKSKVLSLVAYLTRGNSDYDFWNDKTYQDFINMIGEPLLKEQLKELHRRSHETH